MAKGKKYLEASGKVDRDAFYSRADAVKLIKETAFTKFDPTVEIHLRLGVDPRHADQQVRDVIVLPHGLGKSVTVLVFAEGEDARLAEEAGADYIADDEMIKKIQGGWTDFDVAVATSEAMKEVRKLGKILGPRGLMPNPKTGTVTDDTASAVNQFKAGRVEFKMDRHGNVMMPFGKLSFPVESLVENCRAAIDAVKAVKPAAAKGVFIKRCTITSTMGPGLTINSKEVAA